MQERIELRSGEVFNLVDLYKNMPLDVFSTRAFYDVCDHFAAKVFAKNSVQFKVLANLYSSKSPRIKLITAILLYVTHESDKIGAVYAYDDVLGVLEVHGESRHCYVSLGEYRSGYLPFKSAVMCVIKAVVNKIYRLCFVKPRTSTSLVRGWVEITLSMYRSEVQRSCLVLYPFPNGILRQIKFYFSCLKDGHDVVLWGIPYSLASSLSVCFLRRGRDRAVAWFESNAYDAHARELVRLGVKEVFTSDEFEAGSIVLYDILMSEYVTVTNTAHGIGLFCPYINYSFFRIINDGQAAFYMTRNPQVVLEARLGTNIQLQIPNYQENSSPNFAVVVIDQNFSDYGATLEAKLLERILNIVEGFAAEFNVKAILKVHPNTKPAKLRNVGGFEKVSDWAELRSYRPVFITINSTAFYDTKGFGPMLVYKGEFFAPECHFGNDIRTFDLHTLKSMLLMYMDMDRWREGAEAHAADLNRDVICYSHLKK